MEFYDTIYIGMKASVKLESIKWRVQSRNWTAWYNIYRPEGFCKF